MVERAHLAEVVLAPRDNRSCEWLPADEACKGEALFFFFAGNLKLAHIHRRNRLFALLLELSIDLPAAFVVATIVEELTVVSETAKARLLVVLADIWLIIPSHSCSNV